MTLQPNQLVLNVNCGTHARIVRPCTSRRNGSVKSYVVFVETNAGGRNEEWSVDEIMDLQTWLQANSTALYA